VGVEIIKNVIPHSLCVAAEAAWPSADWPFWHRYNGATANKYGSMDRNRIPAACLAALDALALAVIPYIGDSFIDYDLHAAGLHMIPPGGFLARHLDAERHPIHPWRRTVSIVMSVNSNWDATRFGGELRLEHGSDMQVIAPEIGTAVIFTTEGQWHEVLPVSDCQSTCCNQWRKTLALFAWDSNPEYDARTSANFGE
jgi:Rps23 Pro-64 3,4-dihydroxylase Tpa1-like proline 4-hydroxylase